MSLPKVILKKNEERRLKSGHLWIFSNEIEKFPASTVNGSVVDVFNHKEYFVCKAFYNRNSLITLRVLTKNFDEEIDKSFFRKRLLDAFEFRNGYLRNNSSFRLVNGESDYLPGLVIDKFENNFSIQTFSAGMETNLENIVSLLVELFDAEMIIAKNDFSMRELEGLERYVKILYGKNDKSPVPFITIIDSIKYKIDILAGQKTGFYLDQVNSRYLIRNYINENSEVYDLFCNEGGFSLNASYAGAKKVVAVDSSAYAIINAKANSEINGFKNIQFIEEDIFSYLKNNKDELKNSDLVILDPPSFAKSKKNIETAKRGYIDLNSSVLKMIKKQSLLFTFSCSHHIDNKLFYEILARSSSESRRDIKIIEEINCSPDHPVLPAMNETKYLKGFLILVS
jgi:23S rRNA (cytosine1962-C5)-methyltransferase